MYIYTCCGHNSLSRARTHVLSLAPPLFSLALALWLSPLPALFLPILFSFVRTLAFPRTCAVSLASKRSLVTSFSRAHTYMHTSTHTHTHTHTRTNTHPLHSAGLYSPLVRAQQEYTLSQKIATKLQQQHETMPSLSPRVCCGVRIVSCML